MNLIKNMRIIETYLSFDCGLEIAEQIHRLFCEVTGNVITMSLMKKTPTISEAILAVRRIKNYLIENEMNDSLKKLDVFFAMITSDYEKDYYKVRGKVKLAFKPYDRDFGHGLIHATGYRVLLGDNLWWYEYYDPNLDAFFYG